MARRKSKAIMRSAASLLGTLALLMALTPASAQTTRITCSSSSLCPESSPCCSAEGVCGSGAMQCAGGCDPMSSFKPSSCLPNPVCRSRQMTIKPSDYNNPDVFTPILEYNGNASTPFTLDSGTLGPGPEGVLLQLRAAQQAKISTTDYLMYGYVEATLRHNAQQGMVATFILMSSIKDEVDWEFATNGSVGMTNYFYMGIPVHDHGVNVSPANFSVSDWHTYGLNWTSSQLQWTIDGTVVRTLTRSQAGTSYPRSPSRIQFSTWAGGNETNPEGTIEWAGGPIDWNTPEYKQNGFYSQEIKQFNVQCAPLSGLNLTSVGLSDGGNVTSFVYTGANSSTTLEPEFGTSSNPLRTLSDPAADGIPGYPGYDTANDKADKGSKDGKNSKDGNKDGDGDNKDAPAQSSSVSTSDALKYALPISGAIVGLAALWGIIAFVRSRHLKAPIINAIGVTGVHDPRFTGPSSGAFARPTNNVAASAYQDLEHEPTSIYRNEPNMNLMLGGGIMSDAGLSHLQRQTTGGSKVSRSSSRSIAERLLRNTSKGQRYQQLDATLEEEGGMEQVSRPAASSVVGGSRFSAGPNAYHYDHAYEQAQQVDDHDDIHTHRYGASQDYYSTPISSPVKRTNTAEGYYDRRLAGDSSFEACQLQSPPRRALPMTPYMPNYAPSPVAPQRPSGRMYDTPNVNYYPTPVMVQSEGYPAGGYVGHPHNGQYGAPGGNHNGGYAPQPPPGHY